MLILSRRQAGRLHFADHCRVIMAWISERPSRPPSGIAKNRRNSLIKVRHKLFLVPNIDGTLRVCRAPFVLSGFPNGESEQS